MISTLRARASQQDLRSKFRSPTVPPTAARPALADSPPRLLRELPELDDLRCLQFQ